MRCQSVYPQSARGPYSDETGRGWSGPLRCVLSLGHEGDRHWNSGINWAEAADPAVLVVENALGWCSWRELFPADVYTRHARVIVQALRDANLLPQPVASPMTFYEVYVWWCGVQGVEPYPEGSHYLNPDDDGHYVDAHAIWTRFCSPATDSPASVSPEQTPSPADDSAHSGDQCTVEGSS